MEFGKKKNGLELFKFAGPLCEEDKLKFIKNTYESLIPVFFFKYDHQDPKIYIDYDLCK